MEYINILRCKKDMRHIQKIEACFQREIATLLLLCFTKQCHTYLVLIYLFLAVRILILIVSIFGFIFCCFCLIFFTGTIFLLCRLFFLFDYFLCLKECCVCQRMSINSCVYRCYIFTLSNKY